MSVSELMKVLGGKKLVDIEKKYTGVTLRFEDNFEIHITADVCDYSGTLDDMIVNLYEVKRVLVGDVL